MNRPSQVSLRMMCTWGTDAPERGLRVHSDPGYNRFRARDGRAGFDVVVGTLWFVCCVEWGT